MSATPTNADRAARLQMVLAGKGGHDYLEHGLRDLIADALHLACATGLDPMCEAEAGVDHWITEALEGVTPPESALDAAPLDVWQTVFEGCVEEGQIWRPLFTLSLVDGQYRIRDERDNGTRGELVPTIEKAIHYVLDSYEFDAKRVFSHACSPAQALAMLSVIDKIAAEHTHR